MIFCIFVELCGLIFVMIVLAFWFDHLYSFVHRLTPFSSKPLIYIFLTDLVVGLILPHIFFSPTEKVGYLIISYLSYSLPPPHFLSKESCYLPFHHGCSEMDREPKVDQSNLTGSGLSLFAETQ